MGTNLHLVTFQGAYIHMVAVLMEDTFLASCESEDDYHNIPFVVLSVNTVIDASLVVIFVPASTISFVSKKQINSFHEFG